MPAEIQAIYFMTPTWTVARAEAYLSKHGYFPIKAMHKVGHEMRYRLRNPDDFVRFWTAVAANGAHVVYGQLKKTQPPLAQTTNVKAPKPRLYSSTITR